MSIWKHAIYKRCKTYTIWGKAQSAFHLARGIVSYDTPGHGGFHISPRLMKEIPEYAYKNGMPSCKDGWFEEDCDWCIPVIFLKKHLQHLEGFENTLQAALLTFEKYHSEAYAKYHYDSVTKQ